VGHFFRTLARTKQAVRDSAGMLANEEEKAYRQMAVRTEGICIRRGFDGLSPFAGMSREGDPIDDLLFPDGYWAPLDSCCIHRPCQSAAWWSSLEVA